MRYKIEKIGQQVRVETEASFTLIDFLAFFTCLLLGIFFAVFLWIFASAILVRLFTKKEFVFDYANNEVRQYLLIASYVRIKRFRFDFSELLVVILTNAESGPVLFEFGTRQAEWYTLEIRTKSRVYPMVKCEADEFEDIYALYFEMEQQLGDILFFQSEFMDFEGRGWNKS